MQNFPLIYYKEMKVTDFLIIKNDWKIIHLFNFQNKTISSFSITSINKLLFLSIIRKNEDQVI